MRACLLVYSLLSAPLLGCGGDPNRPDLTPGPAIANLNLSGRWYCSQFGDTQIVHTGDKITGQYEDPRGPDHNGTFQGHIRGDTVDVDWVKPGNPVAAIAGMRGKAWWRVSQGGKVLTGRWGYDEDNWGGGDWVLEKSNYTP
ncbi:hypothetical protein KKF91_13215 [Myxococcota bacterium]|nr:hypothetical protein [Myxococcota bacterium]MBU1431496.1 hypothetical protein [Myxococcota bacterium]MBU1900614.1 hypothetical protein [Myxococcota bacterium]